MGTLTISSKSLYIVAYDSGSLGLITFDKDRAMKLAQKMHGAIVELPVITDFRKENDGQAEVE